MNTTTTRWMPLSRRGWIEQINMSNNAWYKGRDTRKDRNGTAYIFIATPFSAEGVERSIKKHYGMRAEVIMNVRKRIEHDEPYVINEYEIYLNLRRS